MAWYGGDGMNILDRIVTSNVHAAGFMQLRVEAFFRTSSAENMAFPAAASAACGFICAEKGADHPLAIAAVCLMIISWILSGLLSGFLRRWYFIPYAAIFNLLPYLFISETEKGGSESDEILAFGTRLVSETAVSPLSALGIDSFTVSAIIAGAAALCVVIGFYVRKNARSSRAYCKIRINMLSNGKE